MALPQEVMPIAGASRLPAGGRGAVGGSRDARDLAVALLGDKPVQQVGDPVADLVADGPDLLQGLAGWVVEFPVLVVFPWQERAGIAEQPIVTTTSAARTNSSVQGLGNSWEMSMPISAMAATASGLTEHAVTGSAPPDHAIARSLARWVNQPSAICERPALCTQRNSTEGTLLAARLSAWASARRRWRVNRSAPMTSQRSMVALAAEFGVAAEQQRLDGFLAEHAAELLVQVPGRAEQAFPRGPGS